MDSELLGNISGAKQIVDWFGRWPGFHDAEVVSIALDRSGVSQVVVHAFNMTDQLNDRGYYICDKHALVTFRFEEIVSATLDGFNHQNVLFGLEVTLGSEGFSVQLDATYGVSGSVTARRLTLSLEPGMLAASVYSETKVGA